MRQSAPPPGHPADSSSVEPQTGKVRLIVLTALGVNLALALAAFLYTFITSGLSARFDEKHFLEEAKKLDFTYDKGRFTSEMWTCGIKTYIDKTASDEETMYGTACGMHKAARWLTFVIFILSGSVFGLVFTDSRQEGNILYAV